MNYVIKTNLNRIQSYETQDRVYYAISLYVSIGLGSPFRIYIHAYENIIGEYKDSNDYINNVAQHVFNGVRNHFNRHVIRCTVNPNKQVWSKEELQAVNDRHLLNYPIYEELTLDIIYAADLLDSTLNLIRSTYFCEKSI